MENLVGSRASDLLRTLADRYSIQRTIAGGGMADVYLATDLRHGREVALKVMRRETVGAPGRQRFLREISIAAKLSHPNIVPLFDSGELGSTLYYVMPFIEGPSLRDRLASVGHLSLEESLAIAGDVGEALSYAHGRGVVHRDIKPGNILLESGRARVSDFGVAKAMEAAGADSVTSGSFAVGTLAYMSPEQASAPASVDGRCDVYSLALVLYEMLAGEVPFHAATLEGMVASKALGQFRPLRDSRPAVPEAIDEAVVRALKPNPADRFSTVAEFLAALHGRTVHRTPWAAVAHAVRRRRRLAGSAGALALVLTATVATAVALSRGSSPKTTPAVGLGRIVVTALRNGTDDKALDVVGLMAGDWLTEGLQRTGILEVVPASEMFEIDSLARAVRDPVRTLAEETGAGTVVSGAYYRRGDSLLFRIQVADEGGRRLVGTITDVVASVNDPIRGLEELRNRLMGWLAIRYDERLQDPPAGTNRAPTYESYRAFSEGMTLYTASQSARALPLFLNAYRLDSSFAAALLYASFTLTNTGQWHRADSVLSIVDRRRTMLSEYDRAWLDFRLGMVRGNGDMAVTAMRTASRLAPASKAVYNHAVVAFQNRYVREALSKIESLQPDRGSMRGFASYWGIYGSVLHVLGEYDREQGIGVAARTANPERLIPYPPLLRSLAARGRLGELASTLAEARRLPPDPYYWDYGLLLTEAAEELRAHGHAREATTYFTELRDWLAPRDTQPRMKWRMVQALYALGDWRAAEVRLVELRAKDPDNVDYVGMTGLLYSRTGRRGDAIRIADSLAQRRTPFEFGGPSLYRARIAATLGERESAVAALRQAFAEERAFQVWLHRDIDFESLREYAPFAELVRGRD